MIEAATLVLVVIVVIVLYLVSCIRVLSEYERAVLFRLGRVLPAP